MAYGTTRWLAHHRSLRTSSFLPKVHNFVPSKATRCLTLPMRRSGSSVRSVHRRRRSRGPSSHRQRCPVRRCGNSRAGGRGVKSSTVQPGLAPGRGFLQHAGRNHLRSGDVVPSPGTDQQLKAFLRDTLGAFPWRIRVSDWTGQQYSAGAGRTALARPPARGAPQVQGCGTRLAVLERPRLPGPLCAGRGGPPREPVPAVGYPEPRQAFRAVLGNSSRNC